MKEKKSVPDIDLKPKLNPLVASLPAHLKDPANFDKIQRVLLEALASPHSHSDILAWYSCKKCKGKIQEHAMTMRKLGFESPAQYMVWKKIHSTIKEKMPLINWKDDKHKRGISA